MTQDSTDPSQATQVTAAQVIEYLEQNPDFLSRNPQALDQQTTPERELGDMVFYFQSAMISRLRADVAGHTDRQRELLDTSRAST